MVRVAFLGITGILMALQLKALKPDYSVYLCLGISLLIFRSEEHTSELQSQR